MYRLTQHFNAPPLSGRIITLAIFVNILIYMVSLIFVNVYLLALGFTLTTIIINCILTVRYQLQSVAPNLFFMLLITHIHSIWLAIFMQILIAIFDFYFALHTDPNSLLTWIVTIVLAIGYSLINADFFIYGVLATVGRFMFITIWFFSSSINSTWLREHVPAFIINLLAFLIFRQEIIAVTKFFA